MAAEGRGLGAAHGAGCVARGGAAGPLPRPRLGARNRGATTRAAATLSREDRAEVLRELGDVTLDGTLDTSGLLEAFEEKTAAGLRPGEDILSDGDPDAENYYSVEYAFAYLVTHPEPKKLSWAQRRVRKILTRNYWDDTMDNELAVLELIEWMKAHTPPQIGGRNLVTRAVMESAAVIGHERVDDGIEPSEDLKEAMFLDEVLSGISHVAITLDSLGGTWYPEKTEEEIFKPHELTDEEKALNMAMFARDRNMSYQDARELGVDVKLLEELRNAPTVELEPAAEDLNFRPDVDLYGMKGGMQRGREPWT